VLFETEKTQGIVHQHIGVEHEQLGGGTLRSLGALGVHENLKARVG
jgi:hypothetical protein